MMKHFLLLATFALQGCAIVGVAATATTTAVSVAGAGISVGAAGAGAVVSTTADVVTYPLKKTVQQ